MSRRYAIVCALALLSTSVVAAAWSGKGLNEPSTRFDRLDGFMFQTPDTAPTGNKVYLNGFAGDGQVVITPESPNSAILGSQFATLKAMPFAILGVWKDCNRDGYIGGGDNVVFEYRSELLLGDTSLCPPTPNTPLVHNDGTWVREFFPITWANLTRMEWNGGVPPDNFSMVDGGARVWADRGYMTQSLTVPCRQVPQPEGTFQTTGGAIAYADCNTGWQLTNAANSVGTVGGVQIGFNDVAYGDQWKSDSVLNQGEQLGESSDASYVTVVDCSSPAASTERQAVQDPTGLVPATRKDADGNILTVDQVNVYPPAPSANPSGSALGTANRTEVQTLQRCRSGTDPTNERPGVNAGNGTAQPRYPNFRGFYGQTRADNLDCVENMGDFVVYFVQPFAACEVSFPKGARTRPDAELYSPGSVQRKTYRQPPVPTGDPVTDTNNQVNYAVQTQVIDPFVNQPQNDLFMSAGAYTGQVWMTFDYLPFDPSPKGQYITYHAFVSPAAISKYGLILPGGTGAYGAEACATSVGTFNCDRDMWWKDANGNNVPIPNARDFRQPAPGCTPDVTCSQDNVHWGLEEPRTFLNDPFQLRDVDCYDNSVKAQRDQGLSPAQLVGEGCLT